MKIVTTDEVEKMLDDPEVEIIDVREAIEVQQGTIPGAKHIALQQLPAHLDEFTQDKKYVIICRSGNRSGMATNFLNAQGIDAYNMVGGMLEWTGAVVR